MLLLVFPRATHSLYRISFPWSWLRTEGGREWEDEKGERRKEREIWEGRGETGREAAGMMMKEKEGGTEGEEGRRTRQKRIKNEGEHYFLFHK